MKLVRPELVVFLLAGVALSWNLWNIGIASGYIDPILRFGAQDEAVYTREAITMAREGGWTTPTFLGRWVFEKPPMLVWLSALSMKLFGIGRLPARLPAVLAGSLICALCFSIARRERTMAAGVTAAVMALTSEILFTMSRHNMTDILLTAANVSAIACLQRNWWTGFSIAIACGIMSKSVAGLLLIAVVAIWAVVFRDRQVWVRALIACVAALAIASPWFAYNFMVHRDWFLADTKFQLITTCRSWRQTASGNHLWFYISRILRSDLQTVVVLALALPAIRTALRRRNSMAVLLTSGALVFFTALMVFRFHSEQYLTWFMPWLILLAAVYSPVLGDRWAWIATAVFLAIFADRAARSGYYRAGSTIAAAPVLERYCGQRRMTDLYILGVDDEFYGAVLPLERVRYGFVDPMDLAARAQPHLALLGILISAGEYAAFNDRMTVYEQRLRNWGLNSTQAMGTAITAHDSAGLRRLVRDHPESDFLVARAILPEPEKDAQHRVVFANADFALLESLAPDSTTGVKGRREPASWSCQM